MTKKDMVLHGLYFILISAALYMVMLALGGIPEVMLALKILQ